MLDKTSGSEHYEYDAFISYRSKEEPDRQVAEVLQRGLERFPIPRRFRHNTVAPRWWGSRLRVFRDAVDLNAAPGLSVALREKLRVSRFLIVICTPSLRHSDYCREEVEQFREYHGGARILTVLASGDPEDSIPEFLTVSSDDPEKPSQAPLAVDVSAESLTKIIANVKGHGIPRARQARFKLLAPLLGCKSPDELVQRHKQQLRQLASTLVATTLLLVLTRLRVAGFGRLPTFWKHSTSKRSPNSNAVNVLMTPTVT